MSVAAAGIALAAGLPGPAIAARARLEVGSAAPLPASARVLGALAASTQVPLAIALEPQDPAGLHTLATAISTP
jgi:hypothetical protein